MRTRVLYIGGPIDGLETEVHGRPGVLRYPAPVAPTASMAAVGYVEHWYRLGGTVGNVARYEYVGEVATSSGSSTSA